MMISECWRLQMLLGASSTAEIATHGVQGPAGAASDPCRRWREGVARQAVRVAHLEAVEVLRLEVVGRAAAPVHNVLVLALAAQLAVPVGDPQVVVHEALAGRAILQHRVEEGLRVAGQGGDGEPWAPTTRPPQPGGGLRSPTSAGSSVYV